MSTDKPQEGWHRPPGSRKFHYFVNAGLTSLCHRYGFAFDAVLQPDNGKASSDDCTECRKKMTKRMPTGGAE